MRIGDTFIQADGLWEVTSYGYHWISTIGKLTELELIIYGLKGDLCKTVNNSLQM
jgi:hypothetical protein